MRGKFLFGRPHLFQGQFFFRHECWRAICLRLVTFSPFSLVAQHPIDNSSCWSKILLLEKIELGWLHDVDEKTKGVAAYDVGHLPRLLEDCNQLLPGGFISACRTAHASHRTASSQLPGIHQNGSLASKFAGLKPHELPCLSAMLEAYHKLHPKPQVNH